MADILAAQHARVLSGKKGGRVYFLGDVTGATYVECFVVRRGAHCTSEILFKGEKDVEKHKKHIQLIKFFNSNIRDVEQYRIAMRIVRRWQNPWSSHTAPYVAYYTLIRLLAP